MPLTCQQVREGAGDDTPSSDGAGDPTACASRNQYVRSQDPFILQSMPTRRNGTAARQRRWLGRNLVQAGAPPFPVW